MAGITPAPPSKPAIYNMFGTGVDKKDQFEKGWDRDPNRINAHLQV